MMRIFISSIFLLVIFPFIVAWGPIAHYSMGRDLGYGEKSGNMNLPDAWPSMKNMKTGINDWFCWSHAVQRTGRTGVMPNIPRYTDDGREPGQIMNILARHKIEWEGAADKEAAIDTAVGFVGHNGMDRIVHWSYFRGGSLDLWTTQHSEKEDWADYIIWIKKGNGTFDKNGKAKTFFGEEIADMKTIMPLQGNPKVVQIAQKAARKNRRTMDFENGKEINMFNVYDSIKTINDRIKNKNKGMDSGVRNMNQKRYNELTKKAKDNGWSTDIMQGKYESSKSNAQNWIGRYCQ